MDLLYSKVVMIVPSLDRGGAERQMLRLSDELVKRGIQIHIVSLKNKNSWGSHNLDSLSVSFGFTSLVAVLLSYSKDTRYIFWMSIPVLVGRCLPLNNSRFAIRASVVKPILLRFFMLSSGSNQITMFNSRYALTKYKDLGLVRGKTFYIPNYISVHKKTAVSYDKEKFTLFMVAHYRHNKDHETVFKALSSLPKSDCKNLQVIMFGNAGDNNELLEKIQHYRLRDIVIHRGLVDNPWEYGLPDLNLLSSKAEGTPNVILEGCSLGIPYLMSDIPELKEVHFELRAGELFEAGNAQSLSEKILSLSKNRELLKHYGCVAEDMIGKVYSDKKISRLWLKFLE